VSAAGWGWRYWSSAPERLRDQWQLCIQRVNF
jgi:hypothetical protein